MMPQSSSQHSDFSRHLQGWGLSLALHAAAVGTALSLMTGLQAPPLPEPFQWNVSLVQPSPEPAQKQAADVPRQVERQTEAAPTVQESVQAQETALLPEQETPPVETQASAPVQAPAPLSVQAPPPVVESRTRPAPPAAEPSPIPEAKPEEKIPATVAAHQGTPPSDLTATRQQPRQPSVQTVRPVPLQAIPPQPGRLETASKQQDPASADQATLSPSAQKRDYGWLAEALWRRIEQLKQYPVAARLNRWEGKVVLRAVIKDDGNLADLRVAKSSGYEVLDQDALEILRQSAPIKLPQPLGRPQIVIHVPISYQLK